MKLNHSLQHLLITFLFQEVVECFGNNSLLSYYFTNTQVTLCIYLFKFILFWLIFIVLGTQTSEAFGIRLQIHVIIFMFAIVFCYDIFFDLFICISFFSRYEINLVPILENMWDVWMRFYLVFRLVDLNRPKNKNSLSTGRMIVGSI